jgi:ferrous iron transport protein A
MQIDLNRVNSDIVVVKKTIPLDQLPAGQAAFIRSIRGDPDHIHRLEEIGLRGGLRIEMFRPGNPCIIRLACNKICLRADDMLHVLVEPIPAI